MRFGDVGVLSYFVGWFDLILFVVACTVGITGDGFVIWVGYLGLTWLRS